MTSEQVNILKMVIVFEGTVPLFTWRDFGKPLQISG